MLRSFGSGLAGGAASVAVRGGVRQNYSAVAMDALASTIGNSIAESMASSPSTLTFQADMKARRDENPLLDFMASHPRQDVATSGNEPYVFANRYLLADSGGSMIDVQPSPTEEAVAFAGSGGRVKLNMPNEVLDDMADNVATTSRIKADLANIDAMADHLKSKIPALSTDQLRQVAAESLGLQDSLSYAGGIAFQADTTQRTQAVAQWLNADTSSTVQSDPGLVDNVSGIYNAWRTDQLGFSDAAKMAVGQLRYSATQAINELRAPGPIPNEFTSPPSALGVQPVVFEDLIGAGAAKGFASLIGLGIRDAAKGAATTSAEVAVAKSAANTEARSAAQAANLREHYRQLEKYGQGGLKELESGKLRYYGEIKPATNPGEMIGARRVREWDPLTGNKRTWYETIDQTGTVRSVAPKPVTHPQNHHIFDANGNYVGRR